MAGSGFKDFQAGTKLLANDLDTYLMQQSVMRFPSSSARSSAIGTVVAEGMVSYLDDTNAIEYYDGAAWGAIGPGAATSLVQGTLYGSMSTATGTNMSSIVVGYNSGTAITGTFGQGKRNTIVAQDTAKTLTTGASNTLIGATAGQSLTTGSFNTAVGDGALFLAGTATQNTGVGNSAGNAITGNNNAALGAGAFGGITVSGGSNTALGFQAGAFDEMTGNNNTVLGAGARPSTSSVSNQITLGDANITSLRCNVTSISSLSDARDKTDIADLPIGLDFVKALRPVRFTWDTRPTEPIEMPNGEIVQMPQGRVGVPDMGFIAQEIQSAEDEVDGHDWLQLTLRDNPEKLEATQGRLIPILVKAIQELSAEVEALKSQVK